MTGPTPVSWPDSHWVACTPAIEPAPALTDTIDTDAVVIGAGFTGLSTAWHLARAGVRTVLLEAQAPGWGASGRNNGQVIPTLTRPDPDDIERMHGEAGARFVTLLRDSAQTLFDLVREAGLEAEAEQTGWIQPVHTPGRMRIAERRVEQWGRRGAPVELLDAAAVRALTGSSVWHGGFTNRSGGHVNPLALARSLAAAAQREGVQRFDGTPALSIDRRPGAWEVSTPMGRVRAQRLMLATHSYTDAFSSRLAPEVAREVVPVLSWQMATDVVHESVRERVIPGRQAVSDTHGDLYFMRYDARHRLVTGGALVVPAAGAARLRRRIGERLARVFPDLGRPTFEHVWNGYIGMTTDFMPRLHRLGEGAFAWVGCNGRGVALSIALGREFARALAGQPIRDLALPLTEPRPLPAHPVLRRVAPLRLLQYRALDKRELP
ncbi:MAG: FAD-binding oxidoreductase [Burkholderiaceae bacterium]